MLFANKGVGHAVVKKSLDICVSSMIWRNYVIFLGSL